MERYDVNKTEQIARCFDGRAELLELQLKGARHTPIDREWKHGKIEGYQEAAQFMRDVDNEQATFEDDPHWEHLERTIERLSLIHKPQYQHYCPEWDDLEINEFDPEFNCCTCYTFTGMEHE
jgi:thermostable 8-oxoguanine DNA glycosylase